LKPQIRIALDIEDHKTPQPDDLQIGQISQSPSGPQLYWGPIAKADWPIVAAKMEQIAALLRAKAKA